MKIVLTYLSGAFTASLFWLAWVWREKSDVAGPAAAFGSILIIAAVIVAINIAMEED